MNSKYTKTAIVERKDLDPIPHPRPQEKVAVELPFREWSRIQDCLIHLQDIYNEVGARAEVRRNVNKAITNLEISYNKTTGRWDLG